MLKSIALDQNQFLLSKKPDERKKLGQFFTTSEIAHFMAELINISKPKTEAIHILDAGAGAGILSIATLKKLKELGFKNLNLTAYEIDPCVIPLLQQNLEKFIAQFKSTDFSISYEIIEQDFILHTNHKKYDVCCINPPYFKYSSKTSPYAQATAHLFKGDPNIYASFVAKALDHLEKNGELIFITPRSFTNGLYFKGFRKFLTQDNNISFIHIFKSRKDAFKETDVLQENVIFKLIKQSDQKDIIVSSSFGVADLDNCTQTKYSQDLILDSHTSESFIRIPESQDDARTLQLVENWQATFEQLGYFISTGPVVEYRSQEFLESSNVESIPLINAHNIQDLEVIWDGTHPKDKTFHLIDGYQKWTVKNSYYIVIKRISSKDEKRRISAAIYQPTSKDQLFAAFENHINFIGHKERALTLEEAYGLALILRSQTFDAYFRTISGNTQVNATEIKTLKLPSQELIERIGNCWLKNQISEMQIDEILKSWDQNESKNVR